jgi:hypothetical protein
MESDSRTPPLPGICLVDILVRNTAISVTTSTSTHYDRFQTVREVESSDDKTCLEYPGPIRFNKAGLEKHDHQGPVHGRT